MNLLLVHASPRGADSESRRLGEHFAGLVSGAALRRHDLAIDAPAHLDAAWVRAESRPKEARDAADQLALEPSDRLVDDLVWADGLVVTTPMYNFSIPSSLKAWFDQGTRAGRTFAFGESGPHGLLHGKRALVVATFGMLYEREPMAYLDHVEPLLRASLSWLGISSVEFVRIEGQLVLSVEERAARLERASSELGRIASRWNLET